MAHRIAKADKAITVGEELILPASMDICRKVLGEAATKKVAHVSPLNRTVSRPIKDIVEDVEVQVLEANVKSTWFAIQCDKSIDINKVTPLVYARYLYHEDIHEEMLCVLLLPTHTTANELFKSLNNYLTKNELAL